MKILTYIFLCATLASSAKQTVKVSVYYESLCYDSTKFIASQLYPNYGALKDSITVEFIPYGKAIHNFVNNKWQFDCQHGRNECLGNKYHACALAQNNGQERDIAFIYCIMRERNPADTSKIQKCANKVNINWSKINKCAQSSQGDELLAENGDKTNKLNPNLSFVPTIVYNDVFDDYLQEVSLTDFAAVVCSKIQSNKPAICQNKTLPQKKNFWDYFE